MQAVASPIGVDFVPNIYPTLNLPTLIQPRSSTQKKYFPSPYFNFDSGDFLFDRAGRPIIADEKETFEQWCLKVCMTERGTRLAYSDKIGGEWEAAMKESDVEAVKSSIIRTITETILINPAAEWVKNFSFEAAGDELKVSFDVKGQAWLEPSRLTI